MEIKTKAAGTLKSVQIFFAGITFLVIIVHPEATLMTLIPRYPVAMAAVRLITAKPNTEEKSNS